MSAKVSSTRTDSGEVAVHADLPVSVSVVSQVQAVASSAADRAIESELRASADGELRKLLSELASLRVKIAEHDGAVQQWSNRLALVQEKVEKTRDQPAYVDDHAELITTRDLHAKERDKAAAMLGHFVKEAQKTHEAARDTLRRIAIGAAGRVASDVQTSAALKRALSMWEQEVTKFARDRFAAGVLDLAVTARVASEGSGTPAADAIIDELLGPRPE